MAANMEGEEVETAKDKSKVSEVISELMAHTVYCFSENIDGFSLLEEYLEIATTEEFARNGYFRDTVLAFLGANIILIAGFNGVSHLLQKFTLAKLAVKCLIVILNNVPFMIIRIYMLWKVGGGRILDVGISTNFFFFVAKEAVFIIVYFAECSFSIYEHRAAKMESATERDSIRGNAPRRDFSALNDETDEVDPELYGRRISSDSDEVSGVSKKRPKARKKNIQRQNSLLDDCGDSDTRYRKYYADDTDDSTPQPKKRSKRPERQSTTETYVNKCFGQCDDEDSHSRKQEDITMELSDRRKRRRRKDRSRENGTEVNTMEVHCRAPDLQEDATRDESPSH